MEPPSRSCRGPHGSGSQAPPPYNVLQPSALGIGQNRSLLFVSNKDRLAFIRPPISPFPRPCVRPSVPAFIRAASAHSSVRQLFERRASPTGRQGHRTNLTLALQGSRLCQQRLDERPQCANPRVPARGCVTRRALSSERGPGAYRARGPRLLPRLPFAPLCPSASLELVPTAGQAPRSPRVQGLEPGKRAGCTSCQHRKQEGARGKVFRPPRGLRASC